MDEKLLVAVQRHPCLWDVRQEDYRNQRRKLEAWKAVCEIVGGGIQKCQARFKSLRDKYRRELRKEWSDSPSPQWNLMAKMEFLRPFTGVKNPSGSSTPFEIEERGSLHLLLSPELESPPVEPSEDSAHDHNASNNGTKGKKRLNSSDGEDIKPEPAKKIRLDKDDPDRLFLLSLLDEVQSLPAGKKWMFKIRVMNLITELKYPCGTNSQFM